MIKVNGDDGQTHLYIHTDWNLTASLDAIVAGGRGSAERGGVLVIGAAAARRHGGGARVLHVDAAVVVCCPAAHRRARRLRGGSVHTRLPVSGSLREASGEKEGPKPLTRTVGVGEGAPVILLGGKDGIILQVFRMARALLCQPAATHGCDGAEEKASDAHHHDARHLSSPSAPRYDPQTCISRASLSPPTRHKDMPPAWGSQKRGTGPTERGHSRLADAEQAAKRARGGAVPSSRVGCSRSSTCHQ